MYKYHCLNPISAVGLDQLDENYVNVETAKGADAILVRSAKMHEMEFDKNLKVFFMVRRAPRSTPSPYAPHCRSGPAGGHPGHPHPGRGTGAHDPRQ